MQAVSPGTIETYLKIAGIALSGAYTTWKGYRKVVVPAIAASRTHRALLTEVSETVRVISKELHPNSGGSMRDSLTRVELRLEVMDETIAMQGAFQRSMASTARNGLFHACPEGEYLWVNDTWCSAVGITAAEAKGWGWINAVLSADRERVRSEWVMSVADKRIFRAEYRVQHIHTSAISVVRTEAFPVFVGEDVVGYVGSSTITPTSATVPDGFTLSQRSML